MQTDKIKIVGFNDETIAYDKIQEMAFDVNTAEALSIHYRQVLLNVKDILEQYETVTMDRLIFLMNPKTKRVRIWMD